MSARAEILARIEHAIGSGDSQTTAEQEWTQLSREYVRQDSLEPSAIIAMFEHRVLDYGAQIFRAASDKLSEMIGTALTARATRKILIPPGLPNEWLVKDFSFTEDQGLSYEALDHFDGVMTSATVAIAATGSIVLQHGPGQGRRALTLIPDYHLCIVFVDQIVQTVPAAFARLDNKRPTTFISGPSATADIEMTRIKGVHGPRFMDVVLVFE